MAAVERLTGTGRDDDYFSRSARPLPARFSSLQSPRSPSTPQTPRSPFLDSLDRSGSSAWNSPANTFRIEDDCFIFEFGTRYMRAGLGGEARPRCKLDVGRGQRWRAGDYSEWTGSEVRPLLVSTEDEDAWGTWHELWSMDMRNLDLGLITDKVERALRMAITHHILIMDEAKRRSYILVVPPGIPHGLLSLVLNTMFLSFPPPPVVTLLPVPVCCTVAAGLRSALIVDIGWAETVVTAVYEYREVAHQRSLRGIKRLSWKVRSMLLSALEQHVDDSVSKYTPSFGEVEEIMVRMIWCRKMDNHSQSTESTDEASEITIPLNSRPPANLKLPFSKLADPAESIFFPRDAHTDHYDDHELPLPILIYRSLLALPIDVRHTCLRRIVFAGGGANIPGLKNRLLAEVTHLIERRGWDPVDNYGHATHVNRCHQVKPIDTEPQIHNPTSASNKDINEESTAPAHLQPPLPDPILAAIQRPKPHTPTGEPTQHPPRLRSVATLGAWAGASLISGLHVKGLVEIEREGFLQFGLNGLEVHAQSLQRIQ